MPSFLTVAGEYFQPGRAVPAALVLAGLWSWETVWPLVANLPARLRHAGRNLGLAAVNGLVLFFTLGLATTWLAGWTADHKFGLSFALGLEPVMDLSVR